MAGTKQQRGGGRSRTKRRGGERVAQSVDRPERDARIAPQEPPERVEQILARAYRKMIKTGRTVKRSAENAFRGTRRRVGRST